MVEPLSLDEAYLDVTQNKKGNQVPAFWQKNDCVF
jgi:nucleotidyltransferase/DNA polymerase involved in DNA repair